jgi:hypothetical protein
MTHTATSKMLSLLLENTITNTQHYQSQQLLQLQVAHHHNQLVCLPNGMGFQDLGYCFDRFSDWHSFVMLHVMAILGPAIDPRFYPNHRDYLTASENDCVMLAYGRGAALRTMYRMARYTCIKLSLPGSNAPVEPTVYFEETLLKQAIYFVQAFDAAQAEETPEFSDLRKGDRPHLIRMLAEALNHRGHLVTAFNKRLSRLDLSQVKPIPLCAPSAPERARTIRVTRMKPGGSSKITHDPEALIRFGLTPTLHPILRRYHQEVVVVKKERVSTVGVGMLR